jgi:hypothetical protein
MAIETQKFIRKALYVDAVRITAATFEEIATWCQGEIMLPGTDEAGSKGDKKHIKVRVHNPKNPRQTKAFVGDWLLYTEKGYKVYTNKAFRASFDLASEVEYPRVDGDTIVLGPQCFVSKNGSVLNWNGINYVPQTVPEVARSEEELSDPRLTGDPIEDKLAAAMQPQSVEHRIQDATVHSVGPVAADPDPAQGVGAIETDNGVRVGSSDSSPPPVRNGKRVLSLKEQAQLGPDAVRELITSGEAVLEQDAA